MNSTDSVARTPWYPGDMRPKRRGVYEREFAGSGQPVRLSHWNGRLWGGWAIYMAGALANKDSPSSLQNVPWCGLAKKP